MALSKFVGTIGASALIFGAGKYKSNIKYTDMISFEVHIGFCVIIVFLFDKFIIPKLNTNIYRLLYLPKT